MSHQIEISIKSKKYKKEPKRNSGAKKYNKWFKKIFAREVQYQIGAGRRKNQWTKNRSI